MDSVLQSVIVMVYGCGPDLPHASVIVDYSLPDNDFDLDFDDWNSNLNDIVPAE